MYNCILKTQSRPSVCVTSYDKKKIDDMLHYYESKGSKVIRLNALLKND